MRTDTIVAQCTPGGQGAIGMIRLSGDSVFEIVDQSARLASGKKLVGVATHTIHYGSIVDQQGQLIDQVLFLVMRCPQSFTGENTVEITCHNNPFILQTIIQRMIASGARPARAGEFTQRAVENEKIDLLQAESIHELIGAHSECVLKKALAQVQGSFSYWVVRIEEALLSALAFSQASFEFIEEESVEFKDQIHVIVTRCMQEIERACAQFDIQQHIRNGIRIAIVGSVNAGKSSLFNALIGRDRAIVTPIAGTTRDAIEIGLYRNGVYITLIDTAGLRQTDDTIEQLGIEQSYKQAREADVVLLVFDGGRNVSSAELQVYQELFRLYTSKILVVRNKIDIAEQIGALELLSDNIAVSAASGCNIDRLYHAIDEKIGQLLEKSDLPFVVNARQHALFQDLCKKLQKVQEMVQGTCHYELVSHHLIQALSCLADLTGKSISEASMDRVFREFCVGK